LTSRWAIMATDPDDLDRALAIAAAIVARDGPAYLPIFLRLEAEREKARGDGAAMARARAMAGAR